MKKSEARKKAKRLVRTGLSNLIMRIDDDLEREAGYSCISKEDADLIGNEAMKIIAQLTKRLIEKKAKD